MQSSTPLHRPNVVGRPNFLAARVRVKPRADSHAPWACLQPQAWGMLRPDKHIGTNTTTQEASSPTQLFPCMAGVPSAKVGSHVATQRESLSTGHAVPDTDARTCASRANHSCSKDRAHLANAQPGNTAQAHLHPAWHRNAAGFSFWRLQALQACGAHAFQGARRDCLMPGRKRTEGADLRVVVAPDFVKGQGVLPPDAQRVRGARPAQLRQASGTLGESRRAACPGSMRLLPCVKQCGCFRASSSLPALEWRGRAHTRSQPNQQHSMNLLRQARRGVRPQDAGRSTASR